MGFCGTELVFSTLSMPELTHYDGTSHERQQIGLRKRLSLDLALLCHSVRRFRIRENIPGNE